VLPRPEAPRHLEAAAPRQPRLTLTSLRPIALVVGFSFSLSLWRPWSWSCPDGDRVSPGTEPATAQ